jgi:hypothetical protein
MTSWLHGVRDTPAQRQVRDVSRSLVQLIVAANNLEGVRDKEQQPSPEQLAALEALKSRFSADLIGPVPVEELKSRIVDVALGSWPSQTATIAVMEAYEHALKHSWGGKECLGVG